MTAYNLFDSHSGDLILRVRSQSEFQTLVSQRKNSGSNLLILECKTAKEVKPDYSYDTVENEVLDFFFYQMGKSSDPFSTGGTSTNDEWQSVETLGEILNRRIKHLMSNIRKQQALELFLKHLTEVELVRLKERHLVIESYLHKSKEFLSQQLSKGIESVIEQLRSTKWFPIDTINSDGQSLLDFLNKTSTSINEKGLLEQYSQFQKGLSYFASYFETIDTISKIFKEKLTSIQKFIGHFEEGDWCLIKIQQLMDAIDHILTHYNKRNASFLQQSSDDIFDSTADSIAFTNEEIELKQTLKNYNPTIRNLEDNFAAFLTQNNRNGTDLLKSLVDWKLMITKALENQDFIIKNRENQQIMDNLACALRLPSLYQQVKKEVVRRSYFYKRYEEMTHNFYQELKTLTANELAERGKFRDMHNNIIGDINDDTKKQIFTLSDKMGIGAESNNIELPPLSHFLVLQRGKASNSQALADSILEEQEWVEIGHDDFKGPTQESSIKIEDQKQDTFDRFGSTSIMFDSNLEKLKQLNDNHQIANSSHNSQLNEEQSIIPSSVTNPNSTGRIISTALLSTSNYDANPQDIKHLEAWKQLDQPTEKLSILTEERDELRDKLGESHVNPIEYGNLLHSVNVFYNPQHSNRDTKGDITSLEQQISQQRNELIELRDKLSILEIQNTTLSDENSRLRTEKLQLNEKLEILKNQVRDLRALVLEKTSQAEKSDLKLAQDKIKQLQAIVQQAGRQLDENKKKVELWSKVTCDLKAIAPNLISLNEKYQKDIVQIEESNNNNSKNIEKMTQVMLLMVNICTIVDQLFNICNPLDPLFSSQSEYIRKCKDQIIQSLQEEHERYRILKETEEKQQNNDQNNMQVAKENNAMKISINNFKFGDLMLFIRYRSTDIFEACTIEHKQYYLSPDCLDALKGRYGRNYGQHDKILGYALHFEEVKNDVLQIKARPPYVIVTCADTL